MKIKLYIHSNINGKIFEKRVAEVIEEYNFEEAYLDVFHELPPNKTNHALYMPILVINDKVVSSGKLLSKQEIDTIIRKHCFNT